MRPSVRSCVCPHFEYLKDNKANRDRYLKHHLGGGKVVLGFGPVRIRTLVSMTTDSSHRLTMGKT